MFYCIIIAFFLLSKKNLCLLLRLGMYYFLFYSVIIIFSFLHCLTKAFLLNNRVRITEILRQREREIPNLFYPHTCVASSIKENPNQHGTFFTTYEPTMTHHYYHNLGAFLVVHILCFHKNITMTREVSESFQLLQETLLVNLLFPTPMQLTTDNFNFIIILHFPKHLVSEFVQHTTSSGYLFSLNKI